MIKPLRATVAALFLSSSVPAIAGVITGVATPDGSTPGLGVPSEIVPPTLEQAEPPLAPAVNSSCYQDHLSFASYPANSRMLTGGTAKFNAYTVENIWDSYDGYASFYFYDPSGNLVSTTTFSYPATIPPWYSCSGMPGGCSAVVDYTVSVADRGVNSVITEGQYHAAVVPGTNPPYHGMMYGCELNTFTVQNAPAAEAGGPYTGAVNASVTFSSQGTTWDKEFSKNRTNLSYAWTFGDGASASGSSPTHAYSAAGSYTVRLTINDGTYTSTDTATVTVTAPGGTFAFTQAGYSANENVATGTVTVTVTRTGSLQNPVTLRLNTQQGTATAGADYTSTTRDLIWGSGDATPRSVNIPIIDDTEYEPGGSEYFNVTLSHVSGSGYQLNDPDAIVYINEDDAPPAGRVSFQSANYSVNEGEGTVTLYVLRTGGSSGIITVPWERRNESTSDSDFVDGSGGGGGSGGGHAGSTGTLVWADGDSQPKPIVIAIVNDGTPEGTETFNVKLRPNGTGGAQLGSPDISFVSIVDND